MRDVSRGVLFLQFAGLSGAGWFLDLSILLTLVSGFDVKPWFANIVSSCAAASFVFLLSRQFIFRKASRVFLLRVAVHLTYTLCAIAVASTVIGMLVPAFQSKLGSVLTYESPAIAVALAKVLVTPPQLFLNFMASRFISERRV